MKFIVLVLFGTILVVVAKEATKLMHYDLDEAPQLFQAFIIQYNKRYKNNRDAQVHFEAFKANLKQLNKQNEEHFPHDFFSINQFSDFTGPEKNLHSNIFTKLS